jgi:hypothetical protein
MTEWPKIRRNALISLLSASGLVVAAVRLGDHKAPGGGNRPLDHYPELFTDVIPCPHRGDILSQGRRAEELAHVRTDRYAYDPEDGIRAVQHYQEAKACYSSAGAEHAASRVHRAMTALISRVNTDYAAARLNLLNAMEQERWSDALVEIHRLLLLTDHLGRHEYVEWLKQTIGSVASKASTSS